LLASDPRKNNLAWAATVAELVRGIALVVGLWLRWTTLASALLLVLFRTALAISIGLEPLGLAPPLRPERP
jgi:uncharacterized membrane protein YphA (DoxX/SURF4 family)